MSELCLGTLTFGLQCDERTAFAILNSASEGDINFIDTAVTYPYGSPGLTEQIIGRWVAQSPGRRDDVIIASKVGKRPGRGGKNPDLSPEHVIESCESSLKRLQTDYLDVLFLHAPDLETSIEETLGAIEKLFRDGKVRSFGVSNFAADRIENTLRASNRLGTVPVCCVQSRYNLFYRDIEDSILPLCRLQRLGVMVYNPLAGGLLSGKYRFELPPSQGTRFQVMKRFSSYYHDAYWRKPLFERVEILRSAFGPRGILLAQVALAWLLNRPGISSVIVGVTHPSQLVECINSCSLRLTDEDLALCDSLVEGIPSGWNRYSTDR